MSVTTLRVPRYERIGWSIAMALFLAIGVFAGYAFIVIANQQTDEFFAAVTENIGSDRPFYGDQVYLNEVNVYLVEHPNAVVIEVDPANPTNFNHADIIVVDGSYYFPEGRPSESPSEQSSDALVAAGSGD